MSDQRTLEVLLKTVADTKGVDQVKSGLGQLKSAAQETGGAFSELGSLIGLGVGGAALAGVSALVSTIVETWHEQQAFNEQLKKTTEELDHHEAQWLVLAQNATKFFDVVRLGLQIIPQISKLQDQLSEEANKHLTLTKAIVDTILTTGITQGPFQAAQDARLKKLQDELGLLKSRTAALLETGEIEAANAERLRSINVADAIAEQTTKVLQLKAALDSTNKAQDPALWVQRAQNYKTQSALLDELTKKQEKETAEDEAAAKSAASQARAEQARQLTALLREQGSVLQDIHEQERLIRETPFLGVDEKQSALLQLYQRNMQALQSQIVGLKAAAQNGALDPAQLARVNQELQKSVAEAQLLGLKVQGIKFPLRAELSNFANSFGTTAHQIGQTITGTINAALQGTNQLLLDAVFRTGDWRQTLQGVERQILNLFLTFIEQMAIQKAAQLLGITTTTGATVASNVAIAASAAPAAAGTSIASYGSSAVVGEGAALAAIAAIEGALVAHEGGSITALRRFHSGGLQPDEVPIIAQEGEIMIQRSVAQQPGMAEFLLGLNAGEFHSGGFIPGGRYHRGGRGDPSGSITGGDFFTGTGRFQMFNPNSPEYAPDLPDIGPDETGQFDRVSDNPMADRFFAGLAGFGTMPGVGNPISGPTAIPTFWTYDPGMGVSIPRAVPVGGWQNDPTQPWSGARTQYLPKTKHLGGAIGRMHLGGSIGRFPRMHGGGSLGGATLRSGGAAGGVTINNFTDMKALTKHLASSQGRQIIVDTVRGRRIDLGL
jgi:hypothetical protein